MKRVSLEPFIRKLRDICWYNPVAEARDELANMFEFIGDAVAEARKAGMYGSMAQVELNDYQNAIAFCSFKWTEMGKLETPEGEQWRQAILEPEKFDVPQPRRKKRAKKKKKKK